MRTAFTPPSLAGSATVLGGTRDIVLSAVAALSSCTGSRSVRASVIGRSVVARPGASTLSTTNTGDVNGCAGTGALSSGVLPTGIQVAVSPRYAAQETRAFDGVVASEMRHALRFHNAFTSASRGSASRIRAPRRSAL